MGLEVRIAACDGRLVTLLLVEVPEGLRQRLALTDHLLRERTRLLLERHALAVLDVEHLDRVVVLHFLGLTLDSHLADLDHARQLGEAQADVVPPEMEMSHSGSCRTLGVLAEVGRHGDLPALELELHAERTQHQGPFALG